VKSKDKMSGGDGVCGPRPRVIGDIVTFRFPIHREGMVGWTRHAGASSRGAQKSTYLIYESFIR
jgi:hypothetical protein